MTGSRLLSEDDVQRPAAASGQRKQDPTWIKPGPRISPLAANAAQQKSIGFREDAIETASGPVNSIAVAIPKGIRLSAW
jgi:hypothetical protein